METTATIQGLSRGMGGELLVTLALTPNHIEEVNKLKDENLTVKIDKHRNKRSKDANALMWAVCTEISAKLEVPQTKEDVYRKAIRDVGEYIPLPIRADAVEAFCKNWSDKGKGWVAEVMDDSKIPGYKLVFAYYGSSTYDSKQMSVLLDYLIDDAEQMGLVLRASKAEIEEAKRRWGEDA
jgi:hypothetical protein